SDRESRLRARDRRPPRRRGNDTSGTRPHADAGAAMGKSRARAGALARDALAARKQPEACCGTLVVAGDCVADFERLHDAPRFEQPFEIGCGHGTADEVALKAVAVAGGEEVQLRLGSDAL